MRLTRIASPTSSSGSSSGRAERQRRSTPSSAPLSSRIVARPQVPGWGGGQGPSATSVTSARSVGAASPAASSASARRATGDDRDHGRDRDRADDPGERAAATGPFSGGRGPTEMSSASRRNISSYDPAEPGDSMIRPSSISTPASSATRRSASGSSSSWAKTVGTPCSATASITSCSCAALASASGPELGKAVATTSKP